MTEANNSSENLGRTSQLALGLYHVVLALLLLHILYKVWPPQPWPKEANKGAASSAPTPNVPPPSQPGAAGSQSSAATAAPTATPTPSPSPSPTPTPAAAAGAQSGAGAKQAASNEQSFPPTITLFGFITLQPTLDVRLILLVLVVGALGSFVHATSSFVDYVGNRTFNPSWVWWYLLRPFIGMVLALVLYFVIRGGFMTSQAIGSDSADAATYINPFGISALAALAGMFTKQATDKLSEVFTTLFRPAPGGGDDKRKDKLQKAVAAIKKIDPPSVKKGSQNISLTLTGDNFLEKSEVHFKGESRPTKFVSSTNSLTVTLTDSDVASAGQFEITVVNTLPGGGTSKPVTFTVTET